MIIQNNLCNAVLVLKISHKKLLIDTAGASRQKDII